MRLPRLTSRLRRMHGMTDRSNKQCDWIEYWVGWDRVWYLGGIQIWVANIVRQPRPMHHLIRRACGG